jgi:hypothetical protein
MGGVAMRRILTILAIGAVFCLFVPLAVAERPNKPGNVGGSGHDGGGGGGTKVTTQLCNMAGIVEGSRVEVGIDVGTYGPDITLYLDLTHENWGDNSDKQLPAGYYFGVARVLKATTSSRLDFFFAKEPRMCDASEPLDPGSPCEYSLILTGGMYSRSAGEILFTPDEHSGIYLIHKIGDGGVPNDDYETLLGIYGNKKQGGGPQDLVGSATISDFAEVSQP